ncbi:hypothetical protein CI109_104754 [Kwoniella shandongensis]|uniref:Uncharacterized protein n=1 Tax=Kwoniella shandongensis TaxID=1734106 RepID=A0A5M6BRT8_9TREE|nr:uncharacterized protein CI109_006993 [Kwoniella shandongensis]KAA5524670.1 hypothetical protein CI109_006993 [Kwoniella shandongensis]
MSNAAAAGPSNISQATLLELKAITAEHADRFAKEGRAPVKGKARHKQLLEKSKDPFDRPSPGLIKRLAAEARNDAKRRHFENTDGPSEEQRRVILKAKARKYEQFKKGDYSGLTEKEIAEAVIDFDRKLEEEEYTDHSSDEDESAKPARKRWSDDEDEDDDDDLEKVEYVDEMGRTRVGTRKEAKEAEALKANDAPLIPSGEGDSAYAEVLQSKVIHGDQNFFPVYEPDADAIKAKYRQAEEEARAHHYDASKEVRVKGAGQYQFSLDEEMRAEQMAALDVQRNETEKARAETAQRRGMSAAQEAKKRKMDERKAMIEAKRVKLLGGEKEVERLRAEKRAKEADDFLKGLESELDKDGSTA